MLQTVQGRKDTNYQYWGSKGTDSTNIKGNTHEQLYTEKLYNIGKMDTIFERQIDKTTSRGNKT